MSHEPNDANGSILYKLVYGDERHTESCNLRSEMRVRLHAPQLLEQSYATSLTCGETYNS